ncbi:MAG TPA: Rid family hydrolase [Pseudolabrys sp.]
MASDIVLTSPDTMAAPGGHYSHAVKANGFVFVAGQLPIARDGAKLTDAPFEQQVQQTLDNIAAALKAAGSAIDRLVQVAPERPREPNATFEVVALEGSS